MDRVIFAHLYATGSFLTAKCFYAYVYSTGFVGLQGTPHASAAYLCTILYMCKRDPRLYAAVITLAQLVWNKGKKTLGYESKNKHKKVGGKMLRLKKKEN